jgi:ATP-dependent helicase YprA (DUF1998 family)
MDFGRREGAVRALGDTISTGAEHSATRRVASANQSARLSAISHSIIKTLTCPATMTEKKRFIDANIGEEMPEGMAEVVSEVEKIFKIQMAVWQAVVLQALMAGRDVLVRAGTGAGKSLIYQAMAVAIKERRGKGIVLVIQPILALMEDQVSRNIDIF